MDAWCFSSAYRNSISISKIFPHYLQGICPWNFFCNYCGKIRFWRNCRPLQMLGCHLLQRTRWGCSTGTMEEWKIFGVGEINQKYCPSVLKYFCHTAYLEDVLTQTVSHQCVVTQTEIGNNNNHNIIWTQTYPDRQTCTEPNYNHLSQFFCHFYLQDYICMTTCNKISIKINEKMNFQF